MLDTLEVVDPLPSWLTEADLDHWTVEFSRTGFAGGLNWYRNVNTNWELLAPWQGAKIVVPALYVVGDRDVAHNFPGDKKAAEELKSYVPRLTRTVQIDGCGHWTEQERPEIVNGELLDFLREVT